MYMYAKKLNLHNLYNEHFHFCFDKHKKLRWFESRHDKTNEMSVRAAKTQISLGIRPVWSESSL